MKVTVYSRESMERLISENAFPDNTAVISFYDPAIKRIDSNYSHIDYRGVCKDVFYSELDDLDLEVLGERGYTYDTYFPEAEAIAAFIYNAYSRGMDIICQCEYGQSRSAGCAAAVLEHFDRNGISIFSNYDYYPNQVVFHKILDALAKQKRYHENQFFYAVQPEILESHRKKLCMPAEITADFSPEDGRSAVDVKAAAELFLSGQQRLCRTASDITERFLRGEHALYASFSVTDPKYMCDSRLWDPYAVYTHFRYGIESVPVVVWFDKFRPSGDNIRRKARVRLAKQREWHIYYNQIQSFDFFGKLTWDANRRIIDAVPLVITNIRLHFS